MGKVLKNKRVISILVALMLILSMSISVSAASNEATTVYEEFQVRASGSYADIGDCVIVYDNFDNTKGFIMLLSSVRFKNPKTNKYATLPAGTIWDFKISSYKEGGKITLTFDSSYSPYSAIKVCQNNNLVKMTGKVHFDKSKARWAQNGTNKMSFWKIDYLGCGFYFRND